MTVSRPYSLVQHCIFLPKKYDRICVFIKARKPQWIVHPIVTSHDTVCGKAGLEKDNCRKAEQHKIKTAWDSTISALRYWYTLHTDKRAHA
ncbi:hypothetical protein IW15_20285 [Chryseobacterium soli]|uniref:Uncharacterized protein n=1 Tax=Chryseobacterium soli TaxID=445961 RepID=A0A086A106_9FLAO|nr:hypothetical protein IW15_20285 [Chryseobacterium soli]